MGGWEEIGCWVSGGRAASGERTREKGGVGRGWVLRAGVAAEWGGVAAIFEKEYIR